jgi:hypothetical protein
MNHHIVQFSRVGNFSSVANNESEQGHGASSQKQHKNRPNIADLENIGTLLNC